MSDAGSRRHRPRSRHHRAHVRGAQAPGAPRVCASCGPTARSCVNLVRKELKVKYTASVLGALWSLLNPIVFLAVFTFVVKVLGNQTPHYARVPALGTARVEPVLRGAGQRRALGHRQRQPREEGLLPARDPPAVGRRAWPLVDFVLQSAVLLLFIDRDRLRLPAAALVLYPLSFVTLLVFTTATTLWVAAVNVRYRDVQHLVGLALLVWFWMTPIVYQGGLVQSRLTVRRCRSRRISWNVYLLEPAHPDRAPVSSGRCTRPVQPDGNPRLARRQHRVARRRRSVSCWPASIVLLYLHVAALLPALGRLRGGAVTRPLSRSTASRRSSGCIARSPAA